MKRLTLCIVLAASLSAGCGSESHPSSEKAVTAFGFQRLSETGAIDGTAIKVTVPYGTDVAALVADFELSAGASASVKGVAQVSGVTATDFTSPVAFVVEAADGSTQTYTVTVSVPDLVFAFGMQTSSTDPELTVPATMKRGQVMRLPVPSDRPNGRTAVVSFDGQDIYIPGYVEAGSRNVPSRRPVLWKNGARIDLPFRPTYSGDYATAFQIYVDRSGNKYVQGEFHSFSSGTDTQSPRYWLAAAGSDSWNLIELQDFSDTTSAQGNASGNVVVLQNTDRYITGWLMKDAVEEPVYWDKDGKPHQLPYDSSTYHGGYANNLTVVGSDFYVNGRLYTSADRKQFRPVLWHWTDPANVEVSFLPTTGSGTTYGTDWGLFVDGTNLYAFGLLGVWESSVPAYWKSSGAGWQLVTLPAIPGAVTGCANWMHPVSLAGLAGGDVYIDASVQDSSGYGILAYWLNGKPVKLPNPTGAYGASGENMNLASF